MKILLTTLNAKYIHKNLALRWIYQSCPYQEDVSLIEFTIKDDQQRIIDEILVHNYDVICFSIYIWNIDMSLAIIAVIKAQSHATIIVGGPEVSYESYHLLEQGVDAISIGEGEESIWEYINMLRSQESYEIVGMYTKFFPNKEYRKVALAFLESLQNPYFMELDAHDMSKRYLYLETSRGCPYGCEYCLSSCDRQVRMFSEPYVMNVLQQIKDSDVKQVKLLDRTFNSDPKRALRIAKYMNEVCVNQIFQFEIVAETLSEELLTFFEKEADRERFRFEIGVQSFNAQTLQAVGRYQNNKRLQEVIQRLRKVDVMMHVDLIAGLPFEDLASFQTSFDTLFALDAKEVQLGILKLLKGTPLKQKRNQYELTYAEVAPYVVATTKWLSQDELLRIHHGADAVEKFWNSGKCRYSIRTIIEKGWISSAFSLFMQLGEQLVKLPHPYAPQDLFQLFYRALPHVSHEELTAILFMDYYGLFKQRPPHFGNLVVTNEIRKAILTLARDAQICEHHELTHYAFVTYAYQGTCGYQIVVYNASQTLPKRWFVDEQQNIIKELKL